MRIVKELCAFGRCFVSGDKNLQGVSERRERRQERGGGTSGTGAVWPAAGAARRCRLSSSWRHGHSRGRRLPSAPNLRSLLSGIYTDCPGACPAGEKVWLAAGNIAIIECAVPGLVASSTSAQASVLSIGGSRRDSFPDPGPDPLPPLATRLSYCPPPRLDVSQ